MRKLLLPTLLILTSLSLNSQCVINTSATKLTIACGEEVVLSAFGQGVGEVVLEEDFSSGSFGPGWDATPGSVDFSNPCSPGDGTPHAWMGDNTAVPRILVSEPYDLTTATSGVSVCFDMLYAVQGGAAPCEGPDLPNEGVSVEYSIDGGNTWVELGYWDPNGGFDDQLTTWNNYCVDLPLNAVTANTQIRWIQTLDSGSEFDHWGIDNVQIFQNDISAEIIWLHDGYSYGVGGTGGENPTAVQPITTTTYTAQITTSSGDVCTSDITITVVDPFYDNDLYLDPETICAGECTDILGEAVVMADPGGIRTYENNEFSLVSTGSASIDLNVQGMNTQTLADGTIQEVCINGFNFQGTDICVNFGGCDCNGVQINLGATCNLDVSSFEVTLTTPDGCEMILIPSETIVSTGIQDVCFIPAGGADISTGNGNYAGTYTPEEPFSSLNGCDVNGVWDLEFSAGGALSIGVGTLSGWNITFDDEPIYQDPTYSWSPQDGLSDPTSVNPTACPNASTNYVLTVGNGVPGCATEDIPIFVEIVPCDGCIPPVLDLENLNDCEPNTVDLNNSILPSSDDATITFHDTETDAENAVNPIDPNVTTSNTYWIRAEDLNDPTCFTVEPIDVSIVDCSVCNPPVLAIDNLNDCEPNSVDLNNSVLPSSDNATITFHNSETDAENSANPIDPNVTTSNTYWIRAEDLNDPTCFSVESVDVSIIDCGGCEPPVLVVNNQFTCPPNTVDLNAAVDPSSDNASISFYSSESDAQSDLNEIGADISTSGTYWIRAEVPNDADCFEVYSVEVDVDSGENADFELTNFCAGDQNSATITGTQGGIFTFNPVPTDGAQINAQTGAISNATGGTTYTVEYTTQGDCPDSSIETVTAIALPVFTATGDDLSCGGTDGRLTFSGLNPTTTYSVTYTFNGTQITSNLTANGAGEIVINGLNEGTYTGFEVALGGCIGTSNTTVVLEQAGAPSVTAPADITVCVGEEVTLTAQNPDNSSITWTDDILDGVPFVVTNVGPQTYVVAAELNGCVGTDQVIVTGIPGPPVFAGGNRLICLGEPVILMAQGATSYQWSGGNNQGAVLFPTETTTYEVTGTDPNGCQATDVFTVTVEDLPDPTFSGDQLIGCEPHQVVFSNTTQPVPSNCEWNFGDGTTAVGCDQVVKNYQDPGIYNVSLTVTSINGCSFTTTYTDYVTVTPQPQADFVADRGRLNVNDRQIEFTNTSIGGENYSWDFGDGSPTQNSFNASYEYDDVGNRTYVVTLVADNGPDCRDTARMLIKVDDVIVFYIPNAFTPDGDEFNQTFQPVFTSGFDPNDFVFTIFNRWGEVVFETRNHEAGWDGTYAGQGLVKDGTYVWTLEFKETMSDKRHYHNGHVTILR